MKRVVSDVQASSLLIGMIGVGFAVLAFTDSWWPACYGAVGLPLAIWCFLRGRLYDGILTALLFSAGWATASWSTGWAIGVPVLISVAALYTLVRETYRLDPESIGEREDEVESEIEEGRDR